MFEASVNLGKCLLFYQGKFSYEFVKYSPLAGDSGDLAEQEGEAQEGAPVAPAQPPRRSTDQSRLTFGTSANGERQ